MASDTLWIFGDSFADPNHWVPKSNFLTWYQQLESHFSIQNFSLSGTGPEYSLKKFIEHHEKTTVDDQQKTSVIFLSSDLYRLNFSFLESKYQVFPTLRKKEKKKFFDVIPSTKIHEPFINRFLKHYIVYNPIFKTELWNLQHMLLFKHLSKEYHRCIWWQIFSVAPDHVKTEYSSKRFYIPDYDLFSLHTPEPFLQSAFPNHLGEAAHNRVYQDTLSWLTE